MTLKSIASAALLALTSAAFAQPQSGLTPPSVTPSDTPAVTPSDTPTVTPSQSPSAAPSQSPPAAPSETPSVTPPQSPSSTSSQSGGMSSTAPRPVGGMSQCQNMIGADRDKCLQEERAASGSTAPPGGATR
jgi:hypothetical protein